MEREALHAEGRGFAKEAMQSLLHLSANNPQHNFFAKGVAFMQHYLRFFVLDQKEKYFRKQKGALLVKIALYLNEERDKNRREALIYERLNFNNER